MSLPDTKGYLCASGWDVKALEKKLLYLIRFARGQVECFHVTAFKLMNMVK